MNKKGLIIFMALIVLFGIVGSIAYYSRAVTGNITAQTGKVVFNVSGFTEVNQSKVITLKDGAIVPGDKGSFELTMDSTGSSVDMYASLRIERTSLPENLKFYTTSDCKSELHTYYSYLQTGSETLTIYWYWNPYIDDEKDNEFINSNNTENLDASIVINAVQVSTKADMKNGASSKTEFWSDTYRPYIKTIGFESNTNSMPSTCDTANLCFDVSATNSKKKVYAYLIDSGSKDSSNNTLYDLHIASDAPIFAPADSSNIFKDFTNLVTIDFNNNFNTSNTINMIGMFQGCTSIVSLNLNSFNTSKVTNMSIGNQGSMFYGCSSLTNLYINNFNTSNVTAMGALFRECSKLTAIDLSSFNTSKVTSMRNMFQRCSTLTNLDLSNFNTSNVTDMYSMFSGCSSLVSLALSSFNTSNVTDMASMFSRCSSLTSLDLSNFNTSKVTSMREMFIDCSLLTKLNINSFNTSNVTDMYRMFYNCSKLQTQINIMNANITDYANMFYGAATDASAHIIIGYTANTETIATAMKDTCTDATAKARIELKQI